jgi:adenylate cyclase
VEKRKTKRKLTAILNADVKGYSRLMEDDEEATVRTITVYREVMTGHIQGHNGRVVDAKGDNVLAEFPSVVDALRCGVEVQKELKEKNDTLPENKRMEFRIGINLGDVIEEGDTIYGDGVNIAARLESLSEGGGVCISGTAFDQIGKKLALGYEFLGEQTVKNIEKPVRAYKVLMEPEAVGKVIGFERPKPKQWRWAAIGGMVVLIIVAGILAVWHHYLRPQFDPASVEKMAFPLPEKPSIAVLPFDNFSGDTEQEYLADGMTENIITALSKIPEVFVIARNSVFTYKGKPVRVSQVSEELGVRYVVEGSVQRSNGRIRITAQLIDATKGNHLWAEHFDQDLKNIFTLQDEVTLKILSALRVKFTHAEHERVQETTDNLEAWGYFVRGLSHFESFTGDDNKKARMQFEQAVSIDPGYSYAWAMLGWTYLIDVTYGFSASRTKSLRKAIEIAQKAMNLDDKQPDVHALLGGIYLLQRQYENAITEGERAVALGPNIACNQAILAQTMLFSGRFEDAIKLVKKAMRLNPYYPAWYLEPFAMAYGMIGHHEKAIKAYTKLLNRRRKDRGNSITPLLGLTINCMLIGQEDEARAFAEEIMEINPNFSLEWLQKATNFKDPLYLNKPLEALRKAGLPDKPPLPLPDKPSIAVLPFTNMSDDPKQEYFSDGITEDLITDLSKISGLFVIARNSVFQYKGKVVDVKKISSALGVRYLLEGSVRRVEDKVRINAQLIDATTGGHLWAERYDGIMGDIFSLQDNITGSIVAALAVKLTVGEEVHVAHKETNNIAAYDTFLQGWAHYVRFTPDDFAKAIPYFEKAIELDLHYGRAHAALASIYWESFYRFWHSNLGIPWRKTKERADEYLKKAMKNPTPLGYLVASKMLISSFEHEKAIAKAEQSIALDPNDANGYIAKAYTLIFAGRPKEALGYIKKATRIDPQYPAYYLFVLGLAHFGMDRFEEAATSFERALKRNPENYVPLIPLAATYAHLNRDQDAIDTTEKLRKVLPTVTVSFVRGCPLWKYKNPADKSRLLDGLKKTGLPKSIYETLRKAG